VGDAPLGTSPLPDLLVGPGKASSKSKVFSFCYFIACLSFLVFVPLRVYGAQSESMLLGKRSSLKDDPLSKSSKSKKAKKEAITPCPAAIGSVLAVNETDVFRPAAHLAPSDVKIVSSCDDKNKRQAYALHSFVLKLRYISHRTLS
jgi:hypothetical protein